MKGKILEGKNLAVTLTTWPPRRERGLKATASQQPKLATLARE
jgi:hypothetical protein